VSLSRPGLALIVGGVVLGLSTTVPAFAEDPVGYEQMSGAGQLVTDCGEDKVASCVFRPSSQVRAHLGVRQRHLVQRYACAGKMITVTAVNPVGSVTSVPTGLGDTPGFRQAFLDGFRQTYGRDWTESRTDTGSMEVKGDGRKAPYLEYEPALQEVTGTLEVTYKQPVAGQTVWSAEVTVTGPAQRQDGEASVAARPLTPAEKAAGCPT
jgi:hypothetical protein